jgi:uncharacterized Ntn-hydrolase superfamily protein
MLPTASSSTGNKDVPTGSILIAFSWLDDSSKACSDEDGPEFEEACCAVVAGADWPWLRADISSPAAIIIAATVMNAAAALLLM